MTCIYLWWRIGLFMGQPYNCVTSQKLYMYSFFSNSLFTTTHTLTLMKLMKKNVSLCYKYQRRLLTRLLCDMQHVKTSLEILSNVTSYFTNAINTNSISIVYTWHRVGIQVSKWKYEIAYARGSSCFNSANLVCDLTY